MTAECGADDHSDHGDGGHDGHDDEEDLDDEDLDNEDSPDLRDRQFLGASASVGLLADTDSAFVASLRHAHRVPAPRKLFNFGPHLGNYEVGSPGVKPEATRDSISASATSPTASGAA